MSEAQNQMETSHQPNNELLVSEEVDMETAPGAGLETSGKTDSDPIPADDLSNQGSRATDAESDVNEPVVVSVETPNETAVNQIASLMQEIEALKAQLETSNNQAESLKTQYMRIAADFENFRKRTAKEKEDLEQQVKSSTISKLLPVVDDFERARAHIKPQTDGEMTIHKSYQSVYKQMVDSLKRLGVSPMRPEGKEFDPNLHEAVMREPTNEHPEGTVLEELVRGYFLGEKVLRHAMVKVAAPGESTSTVEKGNSESTES